MVIQIIEYLLFVKGKFLVFLQRRKNLNVICYFALLEDEFQTCYRAIKGVKGQIYKFDIWELLHTLKKVIPEAIFIWQIQNVM
jgi:hypothetical protein